MTATAAGTIVIEATQRGSDAFLPAEPVQRSIEAVAPPLGRIEGVVLSQTNYAPITGATVLLYDSAGVVAATATTAETGYWSATVPYGTYKARTSGVTGYVNELHNDLVCEPACAIGPGAPIVLDRPYVTDGVYFFLTPLAAARLRLTGAGAHAPGGVASPFTVDIAGPHNLSGTLTYSRNGRTLVATQILGWSTTGTVTTIIGVGTLNGVTGASFSAVFDSAGPLRFRMRVLEPVTGVVLVSTQLVPLTSGTFAIGPAAP